MRAFPFLTRGVYKIQKKKFILFFPFSQENVIVTRQDNPYSIKSIKFKNISKFKFTP